MRTEVSASAELLRNDERLKLGVTFAQPVPRRLPNGKRRERGGRKRVGFENSVREVVEAVAG